MNTGVARAGADVEGRREGLVGVKVVVHRQAHLANVVGAGASQSRAAGGLDCRQQERD